MKLKTVDLEGKVFAEVVDGKPVFIDEDGKEIPFDAVHTRNTINRLNGESKSQREAREAAEARLKGFEGIEDAEAARKALETVKNLKEGELFQAGQVEEIKAAARRAAEEQIGATNKEYARKLKTVEGERDKIRDELFGERLSGAFSGSKFIKEKVTIPADIMQARFGSAFKIEDGKPIAYDRHGKQVFSRVKPGDIADFDEALELLVDDYPMRDQILKGSGSTGSGARQTIGSNGQRAITRAEFNRMTPMQQREAAKNNQIVD